MHNLSPRILFALVTGLACHLQAQGTAFTFNGRLNDIGAPANGSYDLRFIVYDSVAGGGQQGPVLTNSATAVSSGFFTVTLDFGNQFPGSPRWLEIAVRTNGTGGFTTLSPRQALTPTPYAIFANTASNLSGSLQAGQLSGTVAAAQLPANVVTNHATGLALTGTFSGDGSGLSGVNAATLSGLSSTGFWKTAGNTGANPTNGAFIGTSDTMPLEFKVNTNRALRLEYAYDPTFGSVAPNVVGGFGGNMVVNGLHGAVIAGGGASNYPNLAAGHYATVLGGIANVASGYDAAAMGLGVTASGSSSVAMNHLTTASGDFSTAMGESTTASGLSATAMGQATLASGGHSTALGQSTTASGAVSTALGFGTIASNSFSVAMGNSTISGGFASTAMGQATIASGGTSTAMGYNTMAIGNYSTAMGYATTAGGFYTTAMGFGSISSGNGSTAMGYSSSASNVGSTALGQGDSATGYASTAMGFYSTASGDYSVAMGQYARAGGSGSFAWNGFPNPSLVQGANSFGVYGAHGLNVDYYSQRADGGGNRWFYVGDNFPGSTILTWTGASLTDSGVWANASDKHRKTDFAAADSEAVLEKLAALPVQQWRYTNEPVTVKHLGPTAQDFMATFQLGTDDRTIGTVDESGVALAAIQGLNEKVESGKRKAESRIERLERTLEQKETDMTEMRAQLAELKVLVRQLAREQGK